MNNETSYFLFQIISFKNYFYVSLGNNFLLFLWRLPSCGGPGQLSSLPSLKSGPTAAPSTYRVAQVCGSRKTAVTTIRRSGISQQCQCFYIASKFSAYVVLMVCFRVPCVSALAYLLVVCALWAFLSSRHSSALYCFYFIVSVLMNKIFIQNFISNQQ